MKELSIKEKAKCYDKALEKAKEKYTTCYNPALLDYIFPKLKENKDKEIRKDIIRNLERYIKCMKDRYDAPSAKDFVKEIEKQIVWLEKQGKQKPTLPKWKYKNDNTPLLRDSLILNKYGCVAKSPSGAFVNDVWVIDYDELAKLPKEELEKQGEQETLCDKCRKEHPSHSCQDITELGRCSVEHGQKSDNSYCQENCKGFQETGRCFCDGECKAKREAETIDKFKPEFKVGDWVVFDNGNIEHITSVGTHGYTFDDGDYLLHDECDKIAHLWSIQDAKDGDVLVSRSPFIYGKQCSYGGLNWCNNKFIKASNFIFTDSSVHPATKEQRDFLFQKMKEAGYTFDFKNKELKKIKNDIEIPFGAKDSELQEATYYIPKGFHAEIDDDKVVIKKGEKPAEWSEDDECIKKRLINLVNEIYNNTNYITFLEHKELLAWLEKLDDNVEL